MWRLSFKGAKERQGRRMNSGTELDELLDFALDLARGAGEISLKYFKKSLTPERKGDGSPVTVADREAERFIRARIEERFPHDAILGEEEASRAGSSDRQWIVDPIDGTYSFIHGVPLYGVLIGLEVDGEALVGAVNLPALNDLVYAARGLGCFWNNEKVRVSDVASLNNALLLATDFNAC